MENVKGMLKVADQVVEDYESIKEEKMVQLIAILFHTSY